MSTTAEIIVVTTPWCHHCRAIAPMLDRLASEYDDRVHVEHLDASTDPQRAEDLDVHATPTIIAIVDGEERRRIVGRVPDADVEQFFATVGAHRPFPVDGLTRGVAAVGLVGLGLAFGTVMLTATGGAMAVWATVTMWRWSR